MKSYVAGHGRATSVGLPANGRTEAESECRRAPEGTARKPWIDHTRRGGEEPGDCGGKTQPGVSHFPCLGNGHRKRKIHSQHLQAPNAQRYLQSKIHGTDFILRSAGWRVKPLSHVNRMRQRNAPSAREASVMKWGNERKTHAWESSAAAEPCRSGATGRRIRVERVAAARILPEA